MMKFAVMFLAVVLAISAVMPAAPFLVSGPEYYDEAEPATPGLVDLSEWSRYHYGEFFWNINLIIEGRGEFFIDEETGEATVVNRPGDSLSFMAHEVGGLIEDGTIWLPIDFIIEFIEPLMFVHYMPPRVERLDLTIWDAENFADVREIAHTTAMPHGEIANYYVRFMSEYLPARSPFSYAELDAAIWIVEELLAMGHDFDNIEVQEFTYWDLFEYYEIWVPWSWVTSPGMIGESREELIREDRVSQNVVLTLPGRSERKIIVGAHYDSPPYPGASDNASGTALLLESAFRMLELDHYYTIVYVFFGAEEVGLIGAYYFHANLSDEERDNIVLMVNADVLIEGPYLIYGAGGLPVIEDEEELEIFRERLIEEMVENAIRMNALWREQLEQMREEMIEGILYEIEGEYDIYVHGFVEIFTFDDFEVTEADFHWIFDLSASELMSIAMRFGLVEFDMDEYAQMVSSLAAELSLQHDFELISIQENIGLPSDQLVFLNAGHTVVMLAGFERVENLEFPGWFIIQDEFTMTVLHSPQDEFYYIEARWPGMIFNNMRGFGLLLEGILTLGL